MDRWIIPCSLKYFDVVDYLKSHKQIVWKRSSSVKEGDIVYIYVGKPYSEIKYRCKVICDRVSTDVLKENKYAIVNTSLEPIRYMQMELEYSFPDGSLDLKSCKNHGLSQVQKQARAYKELVEYIESVEQKGR